MVIDHAKANKKRYTHVRDYARYHWHNAPIKDRRKDLPEHTELESLMGAYNAGRDAAGRPIPEHPLLLKSGWMETRPEPTPIALGTHGPNDAKGECHEHSLLRDITVVEECQPAPQLDKREEADEEDWKDAILNKPYNIPGPASPDPNQTATYGESMEPHMLASPSLTDVFALGSISSNTERQLSIWSSLKEYDRSLVG